MNQPTKQSAALPFGELSEDAIDKALPTYSSVEPHPGLEARVLNAVVSASNPAASRRSPANLWSWRIALFCTAIAAVLWLGLWTHPRSGAAHNRLANNSIPAETRSQQAPNHPGQKPLAKAQVSRVSLSQRRTSSVQRPDFDPAGELRNTVSAKPNEQERLLAELLANGAGAKLALPSVQGRPITPVQNQPIAIVPLATPPISVAPIRIAALQPSINPAP